MRIKILLGVFNLSFYVFHNIEFQTWNYFLIKFKDIQGVCM